MRLCCKDGSGFYDFSDDEIAALLRRSMEEAVELSVKLTVDLNTSDNWYDLK